MDEQQPQPLPAEATIAPIVADREPKTNTVLVAPSVIAGLSAYAARHRRNEVGGLLIGRVDRNFLIVEDIALKDEIGTAVDIRFQPRDFDRAQERARDGQLVIGWAHSHPTYTAFMSATDARFQSQGQALFGDFIALVVDPFRPKGIEFCFFRIVDGDAVQIPHHYWRGKDET